MMRENKKALTLHEASCLSHYIITSFLQQLPQTHVRNNTTKGTRYSAHHPAKKCGEVGDYAYGLYSVSPKNPLKKGSQKKPNSAAHDHPGRAAEKYEPCSHVYLSLYYLFHQQHLVKSGK